MAFSRKNRQKVVALADTSVALIGTLQTGPPLKIVKIEKYKKKTRNPYLINRKIPPKNAPFAKKIEKNSKKIAKKC